MGTYRILRRLSPAGGFVETYAGRQASGDGLVLLKRLLQPVPSTPRLLENLRAMRGPSMPVLLEVGTSGDELWWVMEGAEGESLRWVMSTLARAAGFIAPNEGLAVVARVATALNELHHQFTAHGDVCPSTIFVTTRGEVQLHDGGVAATLGAQDDLGPWRSELNVLAPEQISGAASPASDVFHLGLVLYELAVGRPLWSGPSAAHLSHAATTWQGLTREKVQQVPEPWLTLLVGMLAVDASARPAMEEVIAVLEQAVTQNHWATTADDVARLFARANQGRASPFAAEGHGQELNLTPIAAGHPAGAVVARIATRKMTLDELIAVRIEPNPEPAEKAVEQVVATDASLEVRVANLLVERGKLTRAHVIVAQEAAAALGGTMGSFLIDDGAVDEDTLVATAAELTRTPSVNARKLAEATPSREALALLPLELSLSTHAVPLGLKGGSQLMVAMVDPMDAEALARLKAAVGATSLIAFRAGARALHDARTRIYPGAHSAPTGELELAGIDPSALARFSASPHAAQEEQGALSGRVIDVLLGMQGPRGAQALQLVSLATGLARRMGGSSAEVALATLAARAMVTSALAADRLPHEVPKPADLQERFGAGTQAEAFIEALRDFPARVPEVLSVKAVVLAFAFAAHAGEPRPSGSRRVGALHAFRSGHRLPAHLLECLAAELSPENSRP